MTKQSEVINDNNYMSCFDHGFVGLVDVMGDSDSTVVQAARVSYGSGTKTVREDRGLIRFLMRNKHTSPFEMIELKFHIKLPIFVMRQVIRHRTSSVNEYSGRYSILDDEYYLPDLNNIQTQSKDNKQGRGETVEEDEAKFIQNKIKYISEESYRVYLELLNENDERDGEHGVARELARVSLTKNFYTECYWKIDMHNFLHFLSLRMDDHSQYETRMYAKKLYDQIRNRYPIICEAFEDYMLNGRNFSGMEMDIIRDMLCCYSGYEDIDKLLEDYISNNEIDFKEKYKLTKRELKGFQNKFK